MSMRTDGAMNMAEMKKTGREGRTRPEKERADERREDRSGKRRDK